LLKVSFQILAQKNGKKKTGQSGRFRSRCLA